MLYRKAGNRSRRRSCKHSRSLRSSVGLTVPFSSNKTSSAATDASSYSPARSDLSICVNNVRIVAEPIDAMLFGMNSCRTLVGSSFRAAAPLTRARSSAESWNKVVNEAAANQECHAAPRFGVSLYKPLAQVIAAEFSTIFGKSCDIDPKGPRLSSSARVVTDRSTGSHGVCLSGWWPSAAE